MGLSRIVKQPVRRFLIDHFPQLIISHEWPGFVGRRIDWSNPVDLNEKIQWLICFSDTSEWSRLSDKYLVREYVKSKGLGEILPALYGVWSDADEIELDALPDRFVLKCNHDSGSVFIIDKSHTTDFNSIRQEINRRLKRKFGYDCCEPHYNKIMPKVIAEELLESSDSDVMFSSSLIDYKVWCFNGEPYSFLVCYGRGEGKVFINAYDLDWTVHPEYSVFDNHHLDGNGKVNKPKTYERMLECARTLSSGFPEVRVDFYEVNGKLFFGEMTFTSLAGRMTYYTEDYLKQMGNQIILPHKKK